ncbi:hypothetical protein BYT27DRAFT_7250956 [Phlegmacium glaucopus]|nr:hypothetical protein BYT27DRAFT_7250956 [Phlegmacium glaucopus]
MSWATSSFNNFEDDPPCTSRPRPHDSITPSDDIIPPWGTSSTSLYVNTPPSSLTDYPLYNRSPPSLPVMLNPFASSGSGLAFGSLDGSVHGAMGFQADPRSIPSSARTTLDSDAYNSPWS